MAILKQISCRMFAIVFAAFGGGSLAADAPAQSSPVPGYSPRDIDIVSGNLSMVIVPCEVGAPDFVAMHSRVFEDYRRRHAEAIAYLQKQREYVAILNNMKTPQGIQQARGMAAAFCTEKVIPGLVRFGRAPDPRFFTPKGSWDFLKASLSAANRMEALLVVSADHDGLVNRISTASDQELRIAAAGMGELEIKESSSNRVLSFEKTTDGRRKEVGFEPIFGEWYVNHGVDIPWAK